MAGLTARMIAAVAAGGFVGVATAGVVSNMPSAGGLITGFGQTTPHATYYSQTFVATEGGLGSILFPIIGPTGFHVLVTETDSQQRPTTVLFESDDLFTPRHGTIGTPIFLFSSAFSGSPMTGFSDAAWLNVSTGDRATDFASPVRTNGSQQNVWSFDNTNHSAFSLCLEFGASAGECDGQMLVAPEVSGYYAIDVMRVGVPSLNLTPGSTYAIVWDGPVMNGRVQVLDEPATLGLVAATTLSLLAMRRRSAAGRPT